MNRHTKNGAAQVEALRELYSPPANDERGYFPRRVGEIVEVAHLPGERWEVVALDDPALVTRRHPRGGTMKVGWRNVRRVA